MHVFLPMLWVALIVLKLVEVIDWSWWFVLLPIYGPLAIALPFFLFTFARAARKPRHRRLL